MGFSRLDRKVAMVKLGMNQRMVGDACGCESSLVSHVLAGRRWMGKDARRIMNYLATKVGVPVEELFPGSDRRKGDSRPFEVESDVAGVDAFEIAS